MPNNIYNLVASFDTKDGSATCFIEFRFATLESRARVRKKLATAFRNKIKFKESFEREVPPEMAVKLIREKSNERFSPPAARRPAAGHSMVFPSGAAKPLDRPS
jgi:hypothetical protein